MSSWEPIQRRTMVHHTPFVLPSTLPDGAIRTGADGDQWLVWGRRWVKYRTKQEEEIVLAPGEKQVRPYRVRWGARTQRLLVEEIRPRRHSRTLLYPLFCARVLSIWKRKDGERPDADVVLAQLSPLQYLYVGTRLVPFRTETPLHTFSIHPTFDADSFLHSYAEDQDTTYLLEAQVALPRQLYPIEPHADPYDVFSGQAMGLPPSEQRKRRRQLAEQFAMQ